jgi:hypothetical protein
MALSCGLPRETPLAWGRPVPSGWAAAGLRLAPAGSSPTRHRLQPVRDAQLHRSAWVQGASPRPTRPQGHGSVRRRRPCDSWLMTDPPVGAPPAAVPSPMASPRVALASTLQAAGTTAVLLGSGVSVSAGVRTGWDVAVELVRRVAVLQGRGDEVSENPAEWWASNGHGEPRYDDLVPALARTDADRRSLLRPYFEEARDGGPAVPGEAHHALARLAARGRIPVILTTNFDRLMERALDAEGIAAQVLTDPEQVRGMTPLVHARVTVVKLHGDYASGRMLNSPAELATYSRPWKKLLRRVFEEYGLLVVGWSADYDVALVQAARRSVGRRYAWYWAAYDRKLTEPAKRLVDARQAHVVDSAGADELFIDLEHRVTDLDALAIRRKGPRRTRPRARLLDSEPLSWGSWAKLAVQGVAFLGPATTTDTGQVGPEIREAMIGALNGGSLEQVLLGGGDPPTSSTNVTGGVSASNRDLAGGSWLTGTAGSQSTVRTSLLIGDSGARGLVELTLPAFLDSGEVRIRVLAGLDPSTPMPMTGLAEIVLAVALTAALDLPPALINILPPEAQLKALEIGWEAPVPSPYGSNQPGPSSLVIQTEEMGVQAGESAFTGTYAEEILGEVSDGDMRTFVINAIRSAWIHRFDGLMSCWAGCSGS